jgi:hypothetical protein
MLARTKATEAGSARATWSARSRLPADARDGVDLEDEAALAPGALRRSSVSREPRARN